MTEDIGSEMLSAYAKQPPHPDKYIAELLLIEFKRGWLECVEYYRAQANGCFVGQPQEPFLTSNLHVIDSSFPWGQK